MNSTEKKALQIFNEAMLQSSYQENTIQNEQLLQTYIKWQTENKLRNLFIDQNIFVKYAAQNHKDISLKYIHQFVETLLSKQLLMSYFFDESAKIAMQDWFQPESTLYRLGEEISELSDYTKQHAFMFMAMTDNRFQLKAYYHQLDATKKKLKELMQCLWVIIEDKELKENNKNNIDIDALYSKLSENIKDKLSKPIAFTLIRLLETDATHSEIIELFKQYNISINTDDIETIINLK